MKQAKKRNNFTIFEILIAFTIVLMSSAFVGYSIHGAIKQQKFLADVQEITSKLKLAQDLMMINHADVELVFLYDSSKKMIEYIFKTENSIQTRLGLITNRRIPLKNITDIIFEGQSVKHLEKIEIKFFSDGIVMSKGSLQLISEHLKKTEYLNGIPGPFGVQRSVTVQDVESFQLYPQQLIQIEDQNENQKGKTSNAAPVSTS